MNKKIVITCTILALLLLCGIGFGFYKLFFSSSSGKEQVVNMRGDAIKAIPSDAVMVCDFSDFQELRSVCLSDGSFLSKFLNRDSQLIKFLNLCSEIKNNDGAILSIHYSAKNTVSTLFVISLEDEEERLNLKGLLEDYCSGVIEKRYSGVMINKAVIPGISYAFYNNYLIASTSHVTVESSVRHLQSETSFQDNPLYSRANSSHNGRIIVHINHQNIGKLFSGVVNYDYLGKAPFFTSFTSWSSFLVDPMGTALFSAGKMINAKDEGNFSNTLSLQKSQSTDVFEILPHNTTYVITMPLYSAEAYIDAYVSYLEAVKKINDYNYLNAIAGKKIGESVSPRNWFLSMGVEEIAVASVPDDKSEEKVVMLKMDDPSLMKLCKGYLSTLLGDLFEPQYEETYSVIGDWVVIGSKKFVDKISAQTQNELYFSLKSYLAQTPAASIVKDEVSVLGVINLSRYTDTLKTILKDGYSKPIAEGVSKSNFNLISIKVVNDGKSLAPALSWYSENLAVLPQPPTANVESSKAAVYDETVLDLPKGPYKVKNFISGKQNYLQQLEDGKLRLLDENKRGVWTIPFEGKLCGYVEQVDHYKNNKLQMLFCSGNKLYMLDRLGRWVKSYPLVLKKEVALGPKVYDFDNNKHYNIMVLHTDNTIGMYDIYGKPVESWKSLDISEKIKSMPEMIVVGSGRYWVVRTGYQTVICNENGIPVTDFSKKKRLTSDTKIEMRSGSEVIVTNVEGKNVVLNLQTGSIKKL